MALLLLSRAVGCSPADGSEGGRCKAGCNNNYCDGNLKCDNSTNTCTYSVEVQASPVGCTLSRTDSRCASGQLAYQCLGGSTPAAERGVPGCSHVSTDSAGSALYCCTPTCQQQRSSRCGAPSATYVCSGDATPEDADASGTCVAVYGYWGLTEYCCARGDTCFAGPTNLVVEPDCPSDALTYCPGSSMPSPSGRTCSAIALESGAGVRAYCCADPGSDAGSVE